MIHIGENRCRIGPTAQRGDAEHAEPAAGVEDRLRGREGIEVAQEQLRARIDAVGRKDTGRRLEQESVVIGRHFNPRNRGPHGFNGIGPPPTRHACARPVGQDLGVLVEFA